MDKDTLINALETELAGYVRRGLTDRADAVRESLRRLGRSSGATPHEDVPVEPASTPTPPATRAKKPAEATKKAPAPKTPKKAKRSGE